MNVMLSILNVAMSLILLYANTFGTLGVPHHRLYQRSATSIGSSLIDATSPTKSIFYSWLDEKFKIHYTASGSKGASPLLLVPGFGVGTFHYDKQIRELSQDRKVYSIDLFGQGKSWPDESLFDGKTSPFTSKEINVTLCYSCNLWRDQLVYFIENIIREPCHIAGNSLGGYLAVVIAFSRPDLVKSLVLYNPTPFWGFASPDGRRWPWDGVLPAPPAILKFGSSYFDLMRNPSTVTTMLSSVYASEDGFDQKLVNDILQSASHPGGSEAFTSIVFAPKLNETFDNMLKSIRDKVIVSLVFGKDDPWIVPFWGQRMKRILGAYAVYFELSPTGHCPHHESPNAANAVTQALLHAVDDLRQQSLVPACGGCDDSSIESRLSTEEYISFIKDHISQDQRVLSAQGVYREGVREVMAQIVDGRPRNFFEFIGAIFHRDFE